MNKIDANPPLVVITDPGEDLDDTFALLLAATSEKFFFAGVISTNEDLTPEGVGRVACYARVLLNAMGREKVPVFQGESHGKHPFLCHEDLENLTPQNHDYLSFVKDLSQTHEKVYLLGIGAMTPLAQIANAKWFDSKCFSIFQMGGSLQRSEYNLKGDIESARIVLTKGNKVCWITSDTTFQQEMQVHPSSAVYKKIDELPQRLAKLMKNNFFRFRQAYERLGYFPYLSDAVAFSALETDAVTFVEKKVKLLDDGQIREGLQGTSTLISQSVNIQTFMSYLFDRMDHLE